MAEDEKRNRWLFTKEQLANSPSRAHGVDATKELSYRQQTANFIQDMGRRLNVSQLVINTAIVYMHRFFMHHSFKVYHRNNVAAAFLFLACKVEEQPRKLEHVVTVAYGCLHRGEPMIDASSEEYKKLTNEVIKNELLILQTLGFDVQIRHPHPDVVKCTQLVRASKDLAQTAYFMAHNSLLLTTMCLQYRPSVVACVCIHLACQWKGIEIPHSSDNKAWWHYVDDSVTPELLNNLAHEFVEIYESCPSRFRAKIDSKQQVYTSDKSTAKKTTTEDEKKLSSHLTKHSTPSSKSDGSFQTHSSMKNDFAKPSVKSSSSKHSSHSSGQKPPHKQLKPPFTPQQLAAATLSKPKPPKMPAPTHEGSSKEHSNHSQEPVVNYTGMDDTVKLKQKSGDAMSLEAYKQKRAKQNEMLQHQQQQLQQLPQVTHPQHRHGSKRPTSGADEHKSKKLKESLSEAQKKELYKRQLLKQQQQQLAALQQLPPLPPPLPKGSSGNSPPPPPPPLR